MILRSVVKHEYLIMNLQIYGLLAAIGIIPVIASLILKKVFTGEKTEKLSYMQKQLIIGLLFGVIAVIGTEFGVPYEETVINARDAAPLCAGLIFGAPAGLIAGTIGAVERWFAVYWGAGTYTRLACTIATFLAGVIAAVVKKYMYDDGVPAWSVAFVIGAVTEVVHMLMIFMTNAQEIRSAFNYVKVCTGPMVIVNSAAVCLAVYAVKAADRKARQESEEEKIPTISNVFQRRLMWTVAAAYVVTSLFTYELQSELSRENTTRMFFQNLNDAVVDIADQTDDSMLRTARHIASHISGESGWDYEELRSRYDAEEVILLDEEGNVINSSKADHIGMAFTAENGFPAVPDILNPDSGSNGIRDYYVSMDQNDTYRKCAYVRTTAGKVVVIWNKEQVNTVISSLLSGVVSNRHMGDSGGLIVTDEEGNIVCSTSGLLYNEYTAEKKDIVYSVQNPDPGELYECTIDAVPYYFIRSKADGYYLECVLSVSEADFSKSLAVYLNFFLLTIVFGALFVLIYIVIKHLIVGNIVKVNESLAAITDGNLDTVVDVRSSREFNDLSDDINETVDTLKNYIAEANARIDTELQYARDIQRSALPSVFPEREEIDLYALMRPAKQVGGDFYDFYFLGRSKLVFLVADVSGKGIPASLFMMRAKTILKSYAENRISLPDIFTNANYQLCEGNDTAMFVTSWMGILDTETGELNYVNAGHNRPLIKRHGGSYEYLTGKPGFVLAAVEGMVYKMQTIMLEPGDEIFLYTDGVVEAADRQEKPYGDDRLLRCANEHPECDAETFCKEILADVDSFTGGAPQFDDITELSLKFLKYKEPKHEG